MKQTRKAAEAILYTRVSTIDQGKNGIGLESQTITAEEFARLKGISITHRFQDIASGHGDNSLAKRPALKEAIRIAKEQSIPILVSSLDRFSRNERFIHDTVVDQHVSILSATEGLMDPIILAARARKAEFQREVISVTTKTSLQKLKEKGVKLGNRTNLDLAQKNGAASNKARSEAKANEIADVLRDIDPECAMSGAEIARKLNEREITSGRGRQWSASTIHQPLKRARQILQKRSLERYQVNPLFGRYG